MCCPTSLAQYSGRPQFNSSNCSANRIRRQIFCQDCKRTTSINSSNGKEARLTSCSPIILILSSPFDNRYSISEVSNKLRIKWEIRQPGYFQISSEEYERGSSGACCNTLGMW